MRHSFIPYIITFSIWLSPVLTSAVIPLSGSQLKRMEWNNFSAHSILQKRDPSQGYRPKIGGNLELVGDAVEKNLTGLRIGGHLFLPWTTIVASLEMQGLLLGETNLDEHNGGDELLNVIIGDLNRFPLYIQFGRLNTIVGRHSSELLAPSNLVTRQAFYNMLDVSSTGWGARVGGYHAFNNYGEVKANVFWHHRGQGVNVQYDIKRTAIHFLVGGGKSTLRVNRTALSFGNIYTELSGQEGLFNNLLKFKLEKILEKFSAQAFHTEASYHLPLYYFGNASSVVIGYSSLDQDINYWFGGMRINCFKYFDLGFGVKHGKTNKHSSRGLNPLLQLKFSI